MRIGIEMSCNSVSCNSGLLARILFSAFRKKPRVFVLYNATQESLQEVHRLCVNDGKDFELFTKDGELHIPEIRKKYKGFWLGEGVQKFAWSRLLDKEVEGTLVGMYQYTEANLKDLKISHIIKSAVEVGVIFVVVMLAYFSI